MSTAWSFDGRTGSARGDVIVRLDMIGVVCGGKGVCVCV